MHKATVKVKGTPVALEGFHQPFDFGVEEYLVGKRGVVRWLREFWSSFSTFLKAAYWCCFSCSCWRWWSVHTYARARDANFSILSFARTVTGQVQSCTSCLKFSFPRLRDSDIVDSWHWHAPSYIQHPHQQALHETLVSARLSLQAEIRGIEAPIPRV